MEPIVINKDNFENEVLNSDVPVLVDFWASWCGPCQMLSPIVDQVATEHTDFKVGKVNTDDEMDLAMRFNISSIPCLIVFNGGKEVKRSVRLISKEQIIELVKNA